MTNNELEQKIKEINLLSSNLDKVEELIKLNKSYKKTKFYKNTHLSIFKLYQYFTFQEAQKTISYINSWLDIDNLANRINNVLEEVDLDVLNNFFEKVAESLNIKDLVKLKDEWSNEIKNLKK